MGAIAAGTPQCSFTSTVFTLRPLTTTWRRRGVCALACGSREQAMNAMPPLTNPLRVVICASFRCSLQYGISPWRHDLGAAHVHLALAQHAGGDGKGIGEQAAARGRYWKRFAQLCNHLGRKRVVGD